MCVARALPVLAVGFWRAKPRIKGLSAFLYTGLSRFLYGFRDLFAGLSAFSVCRRLLGWLAPLVSNYTGAIIPLVTITKVTIPCVIDRHYCLRRAINKSNNKCNANLS